MIHLWMYHCFGHVACVVLIGVGMIILVVVLVVVEIELVDETQQVHYKFLDIVGIVGNGKGSLQEWGKGGHVMHSSCSRNVLTFGK